MKIISRSVTREIIPPLMAALFIFTFVFLMRTIAELAEMFISYNYTLAEVGALLLYSIPYILGYVIPMSLLLGIIVGINRLSADSEVIATTSSGISTHQFFFPIFTMAVIAWMANTWLLAEAVPWANSEYNKLIVEHSAEVISGEFHAGVFNEDFSGFIMLIKQIDETNPNRWSNVFIFDNRDTERESLIMAKQATLIPIKGSKSVDLSVEDFVRYDYPTEESEAANERLSVSSGGRYLLRLVEGDRIDAQLVEYKDNSSKTIPELLTDIAEEENVVVFRTTYKNSSQSSTNVRLIVQIDGKPVARAVEEMPPTGEGERIREIPLRFPKDYERERFHLRVSARGGGPVINEEFSIGEFQNRHETLELGKKIRIDNDLEFINADLQRLKTNLYWIEIHKKFAIPFACIVFAVLGLPLGLSSRRSGKAYGYVVGITIFIVYWSILSTGETLAEHELVDPALGIWAANIFFGAFGVLLFLRRRVEIRLPGLEQFFFHIRPPEEQEGQEPRRLGAPSPHSPTPTTSGYSGSSSNAGGAAKSKTDAASSPRLRRSLGFPMIIDQYIIRTFLVMFLLVLTTVYAVFSLVQFIDINNQVQRNKVDPTILLEYFLYNAPETTKWVIPISALMATMICFSILSRNAEVLAFKASGVSVYRLSIPVVILALLISMVSFYNLDNVIPLTAPRLAEIKSIIRNRPVQTIKDPTNRWMLARDKELVYHMQSYDELQAGIKGMQVFNLDEEAMRLNSRTYAAEAVWDGGQWVARGGWQVTYDSSEIEKRELRAGETLPIAEHPDYFGRELKPSDMMGYVELNDYIRILDETGVSSTREVFELNWKLSFPFLPLIMTLLGLPFAFEAGRRGGALSGVFISIGLVILYWGMMSLFRALGQSGLLPALIAAWAPNIAFVGFGVLLFISVRS